MVVTVVVQDRTVRCSLSVLGVTVPEGNGSSYILSNTPAIQLFQPLHIDEEKGPQAGLAPSGDHLPEIKDNKRGCQHSFKNHVALTNYT